MLIEQSHDAYLLQNELDYFTLFLIPRMNFIHTQAYQRKKAATNISNETL